MLTSQCRVSASVCAALPSSRTDPEECAFKPWTNPRPKPKSVQPAPAPAKPADSSDEQEVVEEFVALLDDSPPHQQQQRQARPASAAPATGPRSPQQRSASAQRIGSATKNADLDWDEFIERQSRHIGRVEQKVARVAAREQELRSEASPEVCTQHVLRSALLAWGLKLHRTVLIMQ